MIVSDTVEERKSALAKIEPMQQKTLKHFMKQWKDIVLQLDT